MGKGIRNLGLWNVAILDGYENNPEGDMDYNALSLMESARLQIESMAEEEGS